MPELRVVDGTVALSASLNIVGVDARSPGSRIATLIGLLATVVVDVLEIESVDVARDISEDGQANVDKQICGGVLAKTLKVTTVMVWPKLPTYPFRILKQSIHRQGGLKPCQNLTTHIVAHVDGCLQRMVMRTTMMADAAPMVIVLMCRLTLRAVWLVGRRKI